MLDVPTKPRNLMPDEVRAEHVKLSWQPPEDDGGTPITNYLVRYMDIDTGEWVSACTVSRRTISRESLLIWRMLRTTTAFPNAPYGNFSKLKCSLFSDERLQRHCQGPETRPPLPIRSLRHQQGGSIRANIHRRSNPGREPLQ